MGAFAPLHLSEFWNRGIMVHVGSRVLCNPFRTMPMPVRNAFPLS